MLYRTLILAGIAAPLLSAVVSLAPAAAAKDNPVDRFMISCTFDGEIIQSRNYIACCEKQGASKKCVVCKKGTTNCFIRYVSNRAQAR